jgi:hypothetical protein
VPVVRHRGPVVRVTDQSAALNPIATSVIGARLLAEARTLI